MSSIRNAVAFSILLVPSLARAGCLHRPSTSSRSTESSTTEAISSSSVSPDQTSVFVTDSASATASTPSIDSTSQLDLTITTLTTFSTASEATPSASSVTSTAAESVSLTVVTSCPTATLSDVSPQRCVVDLSETECDSLNDPYAAYDLSSFESEATYCKSFLDNAGFGASTDACFPASYSYDTDSVAIYNCIIAAPIFCVFTTPTCTTATYTAGTQPTQAAPTFTNQLSNPSFSTGDLTDWSPFNAGTTSGASADYSHSGDPAYSFKLSLPGAAAGQASSTTGYITQAQDVYPSGTYEISFWYRHTTTGQQCSAYAEVTNDVGMASISVDLSSKNTDTWFYASRTIQMSASFGNFQIGAYCLVYGENPESVYFDDLSLVRVS